MLIINENQNKLSATGDMYVYDATLKRTVPLTGSNKYQVITKNPQIKWDYPTHVFKYYYTTGTFNDCMPIYFDNTGPHPADCTDKNKLAQYIVVDHNATEKSFLALAKGRFTGIPSVQGSPGDTMFCYNAIPGSVIASQSIPVVTNYQGYNTSLYKVIDINTIEVDIKILPHPNTTTADNFATQDALNAEINNRILNDSYSISGQAAVPFLSVDKIWSDQNLDRVLVQNENGTTMHLPGIQYGFPNNSKSFIQIGNCLMQWGITNHGNIYPGGGAMDGNGNGGDNGSVILNTSYPTANYSISLTVVNNGGGTTDYVNLSVINKGNNAFNYSIGETSTNNQTIGISWFTIGVI